MAHAKWTTLEGDRTPKNITRSRQTGSTPIGPVQIQAARKQQATLAAKEAKERKQQKDNAFKDYNRYMNQQTNVDHIDILRDGGVSAVKARENQAGLWNHYLKSDAANNTVQKNAQQKKNAYISSILRPGEAYYQSLQLEDLAQRISKAEKTVAENQQRTIQAEERYSSYIGQTPVDDLQMGTSYIDRNWGNQLMKEWEDSRKKLSDSLYDLNLMKDVYTYNADMQMISGMSAEEKAALGLYATGVGTLNGIRYINSLDSTLKQQLRRKGNYSEFITKPGNYLRRAGYSGEEIDRMKETYRRYLNEQTMETVRSNGEEIGNALPVTGTLSTYPASFLGNIAGDITALGSTIRSDLGLSHYNSIDVNHPGFSGIVYTDALRGTVSDNLGDLGDIYDGINKAADEVIQQTAAKASGIPGLHYVGNIGSTARNATLSGATRDQAMNFGIGAVVPEIAKGIISDGNDSPLSWENVQNAFVDTLRDEFFETVYRNMRHENLYTDKSYNEYLQKLLDSGMDLDAAQNAAYYKLVLTRLR